MICASIIVPTLDEAASIRVTLESLQPLRTLGYELIVVDGGSADGTLDVAQPYSDLVLKAPHGRARQMNAGASAATGAVLWFLHADTVPVAQSASTLVEELLHSGRDWGWFDVRLSGDHSLLRVVERFMNLRSRLTGIATGDQGLFVKRELFVRVGGFPEIELMEDIALSKALKRHGGPPLSLDAILLTSSRRWEKHGIIHTMMLMWIVRFAYAIGVSPTRLARWYR